MKSYYYFVSQLPFLKIDEKPYISSGAFLEEAKKWLSEADFIILSESSINDFNTRGDDTKLLRDYKNFDKVLRNELALIRGALEKKDQYRRSGIMLSEILEGNPLEVEKNLAAFRWRFIEEKEKEHYFDLEFLILYFLKLQITERLFSFDKGEGQANFDNLCKVQM